jgi:fatty-acyl-CoA synthase
MNTTKLLGHFLPESYDFRKIWDGMESCNGRGIYLYSEEQNEIIFYPYSRIFSDARIVAARLKALGFKGGERVLFSAKTNLWFVELWVACLMCGIAPVPLPSNESFFADNVFTTRIRDIIPMFDTYFCYDGEKETIEHISAEKSISLTLVRIPELFSGMSESEALPPEEINIPRPDDTAFIQFTSGSTMRPKGILVTIANMLANIFAMSERWEVDPEKTVFGSWLPLYHDMGLIGFFLECLLTQTTLVLVPPWLFAKKPIYFLELVSGHKVDHCCMTNFALEIVLRWFDETKTYERISLENLLWMGVGAEPVCIDTIERFERAFACYGLAKNVVSPSYGLAESTLGVSIADAGFGYRKSTCDGHVFPTVGKPIHGAEVKITNDSGDPSQKGIIMVRGPSVVTHALVSGETRRLVDDEGFYNTKDVGYMHEDQLVIMGRADHMFIVNGENYFPHEFESIVFNSGVLKQKRVACVAIPATESASCKQEIVFAYESRRLTEEEKTATDKKIRALIIRELGIAVDTFLCLKPKAIPLTTSGKLKHKELSRLYIGGLIDQNIERSMCAIPREVEMI